MLEKKSAFDNDDDDDDDKNKKPLNTNIVRRPSKVALNFREQERACSSSNVGSAKFSTASRSIMLDRRQSIETDQDGDLFLKHSIEAYRNCSPETTQTDGGMIEK